MTLLWVECFMGSLLLWGGGQMPLPGPRDPSWYSPALPLRTHGSLFLFIPMLLYRYSKLLVVSQIHVLPWTRHWLYRNVPLSYLVYQTVPKLPWEPRIILIAICTRRLLHNAWLLHNNWFNNIYYCLPMSCSWHYGGLNIHRMKIDS